MKRIALVLALAACADAPESTTSPLNSLGEDTPVYFTAPAPGASTEGTLEVKVFVAKGYYEESIAAPPGGPKPPGDVIVIANVAGCDLVTRSSITDPGALVEAVETNPHGKAIKGYIWTLTVDVSACRCAGGRTITHHCDGCGNTFDTCEDAAGCGAREVTLVVDAYNRPDNSKCVLHDFNGDEKTDCDVVTGSLSAGEGGDAVTERWVPEGYWEEDNTVCVRRADENGECRSGGGNAGGHSCD